MKKNNAASDKSRNIINKLSVFNVTAPLTDEYSIMYNPLYNFLMKIKSNEIEKMIYYDETDEITKKLKLNGIIVDNSKDEMLGYINYSDEKRFNSSNFQLTIAPTMKCNFSCPYCSENFVERNVMNDDVENHILKFFTPIIKGVENVTVNWYGGEPLLEINRMESITKKIKSIIKEPNCYSSTIITNGLLLTEKMAKRLSDLSIKNVQITLDGSRSKHNSARFIRGKNSESFDIIANNIKNASKYLQIILRINIDYNNLDDFDLLLSQLEEFDLKKSVYIYVARLDNINGTCVNKCISDEDYDNIKLKLLQKILQNGYLSTGFPCSRPNICMAVNKNSYIIDPKGSIFKCLSTIGNDEEKIGDVFSEIKNTDNLNKWLNYSFNTKCLNCNKLPMCAGGCPLKNIRINNEEFTCAKDTNYYIQLVKCIVNSFSIDKKLIVNKD